MNAPTSPKPVQAKRAGRQDRKQDLSAARPPTTIQEGNGLIAVDPVTLEILGHSSNAAELFDLPSGDLLGTPLAAISAELAKALLALPRGTERQQETLDFSLQAGDHRFDTVTHEHSGARIVEFLPDGGETPAAQRATNRRCHRACAAILNASSFAEALDTAVEAAREITGYNSVQIFRFLPDWSGEIIAESREPHMPPHLGQFFPEADVPRQLREVMSFLPCRAIGNTDASPTKVISDRNIAQPLDLTWAATRSVSRRQAAFLRRMGIGATFSAGLMSDSRLWGLLVATNDGARVLALDDRHLMQDIAAALMLRNDLDQRREAAERVRRMRRIESAVARALRRDEEVATTLSGLMPALAGFIGADGFAFQYGTALHLHGRTPPRDFILSLLNWRADQQDGQEQFRTTHLHRDWPPALAQKETACGVLVQPVTLHRPCQMIWFRGPVARAAGTQESDTRVFSPEVPFDRWMRVHNNQSMPWHASDLENARDVFAELLDVLSTLLLLKEENAALRQFAETAAHDLKEPLRGIDMALDIMQEEDFDRDVVRQTHALATRSAQRLTVLTDGLLELALIGEQKRGFVPTDLNHVIDEAWTMFERDAGATCARLKADRLPIVDANATLLLRLFLNLFGNAIKYRHPDRNPEIAVHLLRHGHSTIELAISDNGIGIPEDSAETIFKPMARLHSKDEIEGSGLGLTICDRIAGYHGGTLGLVPDGSCGARFVLRLDAALACRAFRPNRAAS